MTVFSKTFYTSKLNKNIESNDVFDKERYPIPDQLLTKSISIIDNTSNSINQDTFRTNEYPLYISSSGYGQIQLEKDLYLNFAGLDTIRMKHASFRFTIDYQQKTISIYNDKISLYIQSMNIITIQTDQWSVIVEKQWVTVQTKKGSAKFNTRNRDALSAFGERRLFGDITKVQLLQTCKDNQFENEVAASLLLSAVKDFVQIKFNSNDIHYFDKKLVCDRYQSYTSSDNAHFSYDLNSGDFFVDMQVVQIEIDNDKLVVRDSILGSISFINKGSLEIQTFENFQLRLNSKGNVEYI